MTFFITFRSYGTWLHGDERGSVDREHNGVGEALLEGKTSLQAYRRRLMRAQAVILDVEQRACVCTTIHSVAGFRGWTIHALEVLSNHVHVVVSTEDDVKPEKVMNDFKAWATRRLREQNLVPPQVPIWADHGSTRYLNNDDAFHAACHYVENQLGAERNEPAA